MKKKKDKRKAPGAFDEPFDQADGLQEEPPVWEGDYAPEGEPEIPVYPPEDGGTDWNDPHAEENIDFAPDDSEAFSPSS